MTRYSGISAVSSTHVVICLLTRQDNVDTREALLFLNSGIGCTASGSGVLSSSWPSFLKKYFLFSIFFVSEWVTELFVMSTLTSLLLEINARKWIVCRIPASTLVCHTDEYLYVPATPAWTRWLHCDTFLRGGGKKKKKGGIKWRVFYFIIASLLLASPGELMNVCFTSTAGCGPRWCVEIFFNPFLSQSNVAD